MQINFEGNKLRVEDLLVQGLDISLNLFSYFYRLILDCCKNSVNVDSFESADLCVCFNWLNQLVVEFIIRDACFIWILYVVLFAHRMKAGDLLKLIMMMNHILLKKMRLIVLWYCSNLWYQSQFIYTGSLHFQDLGRWLQMK